ncbi:hypothetical protein TYRP_014916 [Tyrophagus putrescentiae]|nr:hypothetical protein TYRP_014916 [Tyrophagus putrescentiae]
MLHFFGNSTNNEIKYIAMSGCSGRLCTIHRGRPLILVSEFTANQDSDTAQIVMTASVGTTTMIDRSRN